MKLRIKSVIWNIRKQKTPNQNSKEKKVQKIRIVVRSLWDIFKHTYIHIVGMPEGEEREQQIGNLFEEMTGNFPNLVKEIDI